MADYFDRKRCLSCGGNLVHNPKTGKYKCDYCSNEYTLDTIRSQAEEFAKYLDARKEEQVANLRRSLWDAVHDKYIESGKILTYAREIKKLLPNDFFADFCETVNSGDLSREGDVKKICDFLNQIDVVKNADRMPDVIDFMIRSLKPGYLLAVNNLVERAFKDKDKRLYEETATRLSVEAAKVESGVYNQSMHRDVFVAYSSKDMAKVEELVGYLERQGLRCFVAMRNLQHGRGAVENYGEALHTAIDNCDVIVFLSSKNSRSLECEAREELIYVANRDRELAPSEYRYVAYPSLPQEYKKPRVELLLDAYTYGSPVDKEIKEFFGALEYAYSPEEVARRVIKFRDYRPQKKEPSKPVVDEGLLAELERMKKELALTRKLATDAKRGHEIALDEVRFPTLSDYDRTLFIIEDKTLVYYTGAETRVVIPEGVEKVGWGAFSGCDGIKEIRFPKSLKFIEESAFVNCSGLESAAIPEQVERIGSLAFEGCRGLHVYCEAEEKPQEWADDWVDDACKVDWGYKIVTRKPAPAKKPVRKAESEDEEDDPLSGLSVEDLYELLHKLQ